MKQYSNALMMTSGASNPQMGTILRYRYNPVARFDLVSPNQG
ncbi:MAG: hypothetical protein AAFV53_34745 [Myxococcota bacterium]